MQHHYISNLQKANLFLKSKIKELEDFNAMLKQGGAQNAGVNAQLHNLSLIDNEYAPILGSASKFNATPQDYKLVSIGQVDHVAKNHELAY